jgi:parallel beta-helix repeat protein
MKKTAVALTLIAALLFSAVAEAQFSPLPKANFYPPQPPAGIHIESDGSVSGTDKILRNAEIYTLTDDIRNSIVVLRDNIVIDGAGHSLNGNGDSTGVFLQAVKSVTVANLRVNNFDVGISVTWKWSESGGDTQTSEKNIISVNILENNTHGISLGMYTTATTVEGNTIENGAYGISIYYSTGNTLRNNSINGNKYNLWIDSGGSGSTSEWINNIDASNTVNGKPIIYWIGERDRTVPSNAGYVALVKCRNITVERLNIANNSQGVLMIETISSHVTKSQFTGNYYGIVLLGYYGPSMDNTISENNVTASTRHGIELADVVSNTITKNFVGGNQENGIDVFNSRNTDIVENTMTGNKRSGLKIWGSGSSNNFFSKNNFIGNAQQVWSNEDGSLIIDYGQASIDSSRRIRVNGGDGNYWSNYNGTDSDGDGIGDTPCIISETYAYPRENFSTSMGTHIDQTPLMYPWGPPPILMICPQNETYPTSNVSLNFTVSEPNSWIGYSLDGYDNVTITGNITLSGLSSGLHNLTLYALDMYGNTGASETTYFHTTEPFPTTLIIAASGASLAVVAVGLLVYFKKRRKEAGNQEVKQVS